ncbi:RecQ family ATP-dependent DNA helicase [Patulibacter brassicae]|uniref:DNA 3'-5' helicase n=1 Tax=Patulibacter brassicae TaxID=1705717 RepID=A0ABU4VGH2_9ACTN|nr:RecQ family ATP-dependent DNA helicase [Patulibacter brassicae]MDX8150927.1 RecQ family ATP-dependent DNA helicase [Patulibacter brassicae]
MSTTMTETAPALEDEALARLRALTGDPRATFREHQLDAIRDLVEDRARVLCVQRTGWGKSAVYFVATALLRARGAGPTLIVSPLLALMRNQLQAAEAMGLRAHTVNSTNQAEWATIEGLIEQDAVDLLLIGPERLNADRFRERLLPVVAGRTGLLVIDEAHCVSDWGHDFRPDYRRIGDVLAGLPQQAAVLGTTATANDRVVADVTEQLTAPRAGAGPDEAAPVLRTYRGSLARRSLRLEVVELAHPAERLAWLVEHLRADPATGEAPLPGSGIVYALTVSDAEQVAGFLAEHGIAAAAYTGQQDSEARIALEERLRRDEVKVVVATSALGMGYDKPDLGFIVHYQAPGSVVAYYQQVGRAGRGVDHAEVVLLRGREDRRIQDFFISQAFPTAERVAEVRAALDEAGEAGLTSRELQSRVNLGLTRLEAMLKILDVEGAVRRAGGRWIAVPESDWRYDADRYAHVTELRREEQRAMAAFGSDGRCLMRTLQEQLDDPDPQDCGRCAVCAGPRHQPLEGDAHVALVREAQQHLRSRPVDFDPKRMAPDATSGALRKIPQDVRVEPGRALARRGDAGWDDQARRELGAGRVSDETVDALAALVRDWRVPVQWVAAVPSRRGEPDVVQDLGERLAARLELPWAPVVVRREDRPPQAAQHGAAQQAANVRGAFAVEGTVPPGRALLVDDVRQSGWTLAMVGGQLRRRGADAVFPVVLSTS